MPRIYTMGLKTVSPEVQAEVIQHRGTYKNDNKRMIEDFIRSGEQVMEIVPDGHRQLCSVRTTMNASIKNHGYQDQVYLRTYNRGLYMVRKADPTEAEG